MRQYPFDLGVDGLTITAWVDLRGRWFLTISQRRTGQLWSEGQRDRYDGLTTQEMVDVLGELLDTF